MRGFSASSRGSSSSSTRPADRPELTHDKLVAIVDAAAWWLNNNEDYKATDLLDVVAPEVTQVVYSTLLDWKPPAGPPQQSALGPE